MHHHGGHTHCNHDHHHAPAQFNRVFLIAAAVNVIFIITEIAFGLYTGSLALLADAGHNVSDVLGLLLAWTANTLSQRKPNARYTYGLNSASIIAALANAILLLIATGCIAWEAIKRFAEPQPVAGGLIMAVAIIGIIVNAATAMMFHAHREHDLNVRAAYMHMVADAAVSLGVVIAGLLIMLTGWNWLDPLLSLLIAVVIVIGTWGLLRESVALALHAVPSKVNSTAVREFLARQPGVKEAHDLHIWGMSTTETALTAHLIMPGGHPGDTFLHELSTALREQFGITHATIQIEMGNGPETCKLAPENVI